MFVKACETPQYHDVLATRMNIPNCLKKKPSNTCIKVMDQESSTARGELLHHRHILHFIPSNLLQSKNSSIVGRVSLMDGLVSVICKLVIESDWELTARRVLQCVQLFKVLVPMNPLYTHAKHKAAICCLDCCHLRYRSGGSERLGVHLYWNASGNHSETPALFLLVYPRRAQVISHTPQIHSKLGSATLFNSFSFLPRSKSTPWSPALLNALPGNLERYTFKCVQQFDRVF